MDIFSKQIQGALENAIFNKVSALNLNINDASLRAIVSRVAETSSVYISNQVTLNTNTQLDVIPKNILGTNNPVDLVTNNINSQGLSSDLSNILNSQLNSVISQKITADLQKEIRNLLPSSAANLINFDSLAATLSQSLYNDITKSVSTTLKNVTDSIFGKTVTVPPTIPNVSSYFNSPTTALENISNEYGSTVANKYLQQAKTFNVQEQTNTEKLIAVKQGFIDPTANYPTKEYAGGSEVNKLAQGDIKGTVVQKKNLERMTGAKLPGGESWDQPESPFKGKYPYNKVTQTESGHIIEIDDTPGGERLHVYHRSGTFIEIDPNGSIVKRAAGSSYEIIDKNGKIAISGSADISVNGACNIFVGNDANIEVEGDTNILCHNDITAQAGGKLNLSATEELNITSANVNIQAYNVMNVTSNVALSMHSSNVMYLHSNANMQLQAVDYYSSLSGTSYNQATGDFNFKSTGNFNADGNNVYLNSDKAASSKGSIIAGISNIGTISGRKDITANSVKDPIAPSLVDVYALKLEEDNATQEEIFAHKDTIVTLGFATQAEYISTPIEVEKATVSSSQSTIIPGSSFVQNQTELPGNFKLSPNFTVEMLSNKALYTSDNIEGNENIKYGEIAYNLQQIALNILEPAYNLYPNLKVVSGFRAQKNCTNASMHPFGKAVDITFQGYDFEETYNAAKILAKNLNYDQFILEYCSYSNTPWIHISFQGSSNRKTVSTYWNNKRYGSGLYNLL